jgi:hypothetical protein
MLEANNPQLATGEATVRASKFSFNTAGFTCGSSVIEELHVPGQA